jgi:hypothetical protein
MYKELKIMENNKKETEKYLDRNDIMSLFKSLARSQGFYGRLICAIEDADEGAREEFWQDLESKKFTDVIEVIIYIES